MPLLEGPECGLWAEVMGAGEPITVFAHGVTGSSAETAAFAVGTPGTRVLFDFRGHGRSESPPEEAGYDHRAMRRDLEHVADAFGATRALGVSMGAGALMALLAERPERFERVAFALPATIDGPNTPAAGLFLDMAAQLETKPLAKLAEEAANDPSQHETFARLPWLREYVRERLLAMNDTGVPRALRAYVQGRPPLDDAGVLARVHAPALVLAHEGDPIHDAAVARRLAGLLPNAELRVWPEPMAMFDDADELASVMKVFFA